MLIPGLKQLLFLLTRVGYATTLLRCDNVTMFSDPNKCCLLIVLCIYSLWPLNWHTETLKFFVLFLVSYKLYCLVVVANLKNCRVPSSVFNSLRAASSHSLLPTAALLGHRLCKIHLAILPLTSSRHFLALTYLWQLCWLGERTTCIRTFLLLPCSVVLLQYIPVSTVSTVGSVVYPDQNCTGIQQHLK